jgi:aspartyl-tRNA(Asn)/glutamyl-tRNA(Gln) amidotransferase subunit C
MALTREEVLYIARLARISLREEEVDRLAGELSGILDHFAALQELETGDVEPTAHPLPLRNVTRDDEVAPSLPLEDVLANAPETEDGYIRVRAVLE